jgi:NodT family efflux transporter outer membrane factor (OMF) lipoprotein
MRKKPTSQSAPATAPAGTEDTRPLHGHVRGGGLLRGSMALALGTGLLCACAVGPNYKRPHDSAPEAYREGPPEGWKQGQPQDLISRGSWWSIYEDSVLDDLEKQVDVSNQTLKASEAAFRQAVAVLQEARANFYPVLTLGAAATRTSTGSSTHGSTTAGGTGITTGVTAGTIENQFSIGPSVSWVPDVWGRVRRLVESSTASAQASAADLASARLSIQAQLAQDYFELRVADELKRLLEATVTAYQRTVDITTNRYAVGVAAKSDVVTARTQLENTRAQAVAVESQRAQLEHAIAALVGKAPADFSLAPAQLSGSVPSVPFGVPSTLLERRPDIAAAERQLAAANAQIGVAIAAYFPTLTLSASGGFASSTIGKLLDASSREWSAGPQVGATLFDGGARSAQVAAARAAYDMSAANYRQAIITGFQQVEDNLSALRVLARQAEVQNRAVQLAREAEQLTLNAYKAGVVDYTTVVQSQATALSSEQSALTIRQSRLTASVSLIEALGGGWTSEQLPDKKQLD